jgi:hypothetical protein
MTITIEFQPWARFYARKRRTDIRRWLQAIGDAGTDAFRSGMGNYPPASDPGAWPNSRTGRLKGTIRSVVTDNSVTIGTSTRYSRYLREGTSKMARRKMSDNALQEGMKAGRGRLHRWVYWSRG